MTLRVLGPRADENLHRRAAGVANSMDTYLERLVKLVPAEALAAFPLLQNMAHSNDIGVWGEVLVAVSLLVVVAVLRWHATSIPGEGSQWGAVVIALVSFMIWIHVMDSNVSISLVGLVTPIESGEATSHFKSVQSFVSTVLLVIWTILVPVLYRGDQ